MNDLKELTCISIERSGTGIERSGTGIERSGTGIERSGTGSTFKRACLGLGAAIAMTATFNICAAEPNVLVTRHADSVLVSIHSEQSIVVGSVALSGSVDEYLNVTLHEAVSLTAGSSLMVHGSGSGSDSICNPGGSGLMVHGSGSGSSSDGESDCMKKVVAWGSAELVFDPAGTSIVIYRNGPTGPEEFMVEFVAATQSATTEFNSHSLPADTNSQPHRVAMH